MIPVSFTLARRVGDREGAAAFDSGNLQLDILSGLEMQMIGQAKMNRLDRRRQAVDARDLGVEVAHRNDLGVGLLVDVRLDRRIRQQRRAAGERLAGLSLEIHQREGVGGAVIDFSVAHLDLAGPAEAMAAGMRQIDALAQRSVEHALAVIDLDSRTQRIYGELIAHDRQKA